MQHLPEIFDGRTLVGVSMRILRMPGKVVHIKASTLSTNAHVELRWVKHQQPSSWHHRSDSLQKAFCGPGQLRVAMVVHQSMNVLRSVLHGDVDVAAAWYKFDIHVAAVERRDGGSKRKALMQLYENKRWMKEGW